MQSKTPLYAGLCMVLAIAGCATGTPPMKVADIVKDKRAYLAASFSPQNLPQPVKDGFASLPAVTLPFKELTITYDVTQHDVNPAPNKANDVKHRESTALINAGNGFVQVQTESSTNDIPYSLYLTLSYVNLFAIKTQSLSYSAVNAQDPNTPDSMSNISGDIAHPKEEGHYGFDEQAYSKGYSFQCQSGKFGAASALLPKLKGRALDFDCTFSMDGIVSRRSKFTYLDAYGIYIVRETDSSASTFSFKLVDIVAQ